MTVISAVRSTSTENLLDGLRVHDPRQEVAVRILLPIQEVVGRFDLERIAEYPACGNAGRGADG